MRKKLMLTMGSCVLAACLMLGLTACSMDIKTGEGPGETIHIDLDQYLPQGLGLENVDLGTIDVSKITKGVEGLLEKLPISSGSSSKEQEEAEPIFDGIGGDSISGFTPADEPEQETAPAILDSLAGLEGLEDLNLEDLNLDDLLNSLGDILGDSQGISQGDAVGAAQEAPADTFFEGGQGRDLQE